MKGNRFVMEVDRKNMVSETEHRKKDSDGNGKNFKAILA